MNKIDMLLKGKPIKAAGNGGSRPFSISIWTTRDPKGNNLLVTDGSVAFSVMKPLEGERYPQLVEGHSLFLLRGETATEEGEVVPPDYGYRPGEGGTLQLWWAPQRVVAESRIHDIEALVSDKATFAGTLEPMAGVYGTYLTGNLLVVHDGIVHECNAMLTQDAPATVESAERSGKAQRAFLLKLDLPEPIVPGIYRHSGVRRVADPLARSGLPATTGSPTIAPDAQPVF